MTTQKPPTMDENYEKPSTHKQWQERSERPVETRVMNKADIEILRRNLVSSYRCEDSDIDFEFVKIKDPNDEDSDDCLLLIYSMKCVRFGEPAVVRVFSIKIPIPENVRKLAEQMKQRHRTAPLAALPAPEAATPTTTPLPTITQPTPVINTPKPRARKPTTVKK